MRISRAIAIAATTMCLTLATAACGSENEPDSGPTAGTPTDTAAADPTSSEGGKVDVPADWQVASVEVAQLQVPPDWSLSSSRDQSQTMTAPKDEIGISPGSGGIRVAPNPGGGDDAERVGALGDSYEKSLERELKAIKRLPDETINGSVFFHIQGDDGYNWRDAYGTVLPGGEHRVTVTWDFKKSDIDRKGADELIAKVMATYEPA